MRAIVITKHGGPGVLQVQEQPDPELGAGEVRIEVAAAGINFADVMARMGLYPDAPKTPCVVGYEVAGTILELGAGISDSHPTLTPGQRVLASTVFGGYASQVAVPAADVFALPEELSFEQGAAIPVNYGTAWAGLIGYGVLQAGERVLVHSAGGGVGIAATQIAKRTGAEVYGTASPGKHARIRELGIDHVIDYTASGWERELPQFDVILDAIGGPVLGLALQRVAPLGTVISFGATVPEPVSYPTRELFSRAPGARLIGFYIFSELEHTRSASADLRRLADLVAAGLLDPQIALTTSWSEAASAIQALLERRVAGKAVLTVQGTN